MYLLCVDQSDDHIIRNDSLVTLNVHIYLSVTSCLTCFEWTVVLLYSKHYYSCTVFYTLHLVSSVIVNCCILCNNSHLQPS